MGLLWLSLALPVSAAPQHTSTSAPEHQEFLSQDLKRLSLEELLDMEVTVVTRQPEPVRTAAASLVVITRDDIRRSGVTTVPDAIALADGMNLARVNNATWAITTRGFNGSTPNKLLVMVDGRNAFSPFFTGVFWNTLDYVLEDIERIEVTRGPGATLWGANAVNGVINIITRRAQETRGTFVSVGSGNEDPGLVDVRYGGGSDSTSYRLYAKGAWRDDQKLASGIDAQDGRQRVQAGFRLDATAGGNQWLFKADAFHGLDDFIDRGDGDWTEINLQGRVDRDLSPGSRLQVQSYYRQEYRSIERQLTHRLHTGDVDLQYTTHFASRHSFVAGAGARVNSDTTAGTTTLSFDPVSRTYPVFSAFAQDEWEVRPGSVSLVGGIKVEHNAFSGADWQPNLRARWLAPRRQVLWASVARAVRRPTRFDDDIRISTPTGVLFIQGSDTFESEEMVGWEVGYRSQPLPAVTFEVETFGNRYGNLRSQDAPAAGALPITIANTLIGESRGVETSATLQPAQGWRVHASYAWLDTDITRAAGSRDVSNGVNEANDPTYMFTLRAGVDLPRRMEADLWWRAVGALPNPAVPAYNELNARLGWRPSDKVEFALVGQDLLHDRHPEFGAPTPIRVEFERSLRVVFSLRLP
jgi:iron complex outermembrane receptor protein